MSADRVELAEAEVVRHKAAIAAELHLLSAKARRTASSPWLMAGALAGATALAYLATGKSTNGKRDTSSGPGTWSLALQIARLLLPLIARPTGQPKRSPPPPIVPPSGAERRMLEADRK
jgi:hypothetical protein